jgi:hypothetical protein
LTTRKILFVIISLFSAFTSFSLSAAPFAMHPQTFTYSLVGIFDHGLPSFLMCVGIDLQGANANNILVVGGYISNGHDDPSTSCYRSTDGQSWATASTSVPFTTEEGYSATLSSGTIVFFGGVVNSSPVQSVWLTTDCGTFLSFFASA